MGAGLLYHLAEDGCSDVLLIEKGELTSGSTWHAAGQCPNFVGDYNLAKINAYGESALPHARSKNRQYVSWHAPGSLRLARSQATLTGFDMCAVLGPTRASQWKSLALMKSNNSIRFWSPMA